MAARGRGLFSLYIYIKTLKIFLSEPLDRFPKFCRNVPSGGGVILYQDCSSHLDLSKNMAARGRGLFSLYIEKCKNHLVPNHWTDFHIILQKCSFGDPLPRLFKPFGFVKKTWPPGVRAYFPYICIYIENFKNLLGRNQWTDFNITWKECVFGHPLPRLFKPS